MVGKPSCGRVGKLLGFVAIILTCVVYAERVVIEHVDLSRKWVRSRNNKEIPVLDFSLPWHGSEHGGGNLL